MLRSTLAPALGVAALLLAPAAVVSAQPAGAPPAPPPPPGQQVGAAGAAADAGAPAPSSATSQTPPAPSPPPPSGSASPGAPPPAPPGYPYPYPPRGGYPQGYGYPPPGYSYPPPNYPPPGYGYPPPGYGYPPPGYGYPPPGYEAVPEEKPKPKRPPHDAASRSPFFDALAGGTTESDRFSEFLLAGGQVGLFVADRLRLAARFLVFSDQPTDEYSAESTLGSYYSPRNSSSPTFLWGGSAGFAVVSAPGFVLSPGVLFTRTDVSDYGSFLGVNVPFEWVSESGLRIGFELALGRTFGGTVIEQCYSYTGGCAQGTTNEIDRKAGAGFYAHFQIGWGIKG